MADEKKGIDIVLYNRTGSAVTYPNADTLTTDTTTEGEIALFTYGEVVEGTEIDLALADGDQKVSVPAGSLLREATIKKPETLTPEHIKKGIDVAGVIGTFAGDEMEKTVDLNMANGDQIVDADPDTVMTRATIKKPETLVPENIVEGVDIGGVVGNKKAGIPVGLADCKTPFEMTDDLFREPPEAINALAFCYNNSGLTNVDLSKAMLLKTSAFGWCSNLSNVSLPVCMNVNSYAFASCTKLETLYIPKCIAVGTSAFDSAIITELNLPECTDINSAFKYCTKLQSVSIPKVKRIAKGAFLGCAKALKTFSSISYIGDICLGGTNITSNVNLQENTRVLASSAFASCKFSQIENTELVEYIGGYAFFGCTKLTDASFPKCIEITEVSAFYSCSALKSVYLPLVSSLPASTFGSCSSLVSVYVPNIEAIYQGAFAGCRSLSAFYGTKCKVIGVGAFTQCSHLKEVNVKNAELLSNNAFFNCSYLSEIYIPKCKDISQAAFGYCTGLQRAILSDCLKISSWAFSSAGSLASLYLIGSSLCSLAYYAQYGFSNTPLSTYGYGKVYVRESLLATYKSALYWSYFSNKFVGMTDEEIETLVTEMEAKYETANSDTAV